MRRRFLPLALTLLACGDSTGPSSRVPALGVYTLTGADPLNATGTLTLTYASPDSIAGTVNLVGTGDGTMTGPLDLGIYNLDAYLFYGRMRREITGIPVSTQYAFRIARSGAGMTCLVQTVGDFASRRPCTLTRR